MENSKSDKDNLAKPCGINLDYPHFPASVHEEVGQDLSNQSSNNPSSFHFPPERSPYWDPLFDEPAKLLVSEIGKAETNIDMLLKGEVIPEYAPAQARAYIQSFVDNGDDARIRLVYGFIKYFDLCYNRQFFY